MQIFSDVTAIPESAASAVLALGNFDGVHKGHQAILAQARALAQKSGKALAVCTFEPHPRSVFFPHDPPFRLTPPALKAELLAEQGVELLFQLPFTEAFRHMSAADFLAQVLVGSLRPSHVVAGFDFTFGHKRGGNMHLLTETLARQGIGATEVPPRRDEGGVLWSSTRVRDHLTAGEPEAAADILGRPFMITGVVRHGDQRGRTIGYPTANIALGEFLHPRFGVYAVRAQRADGSALVGVANIGRRPTVGGADEQLEAHFFDFTGDLYGQALRVALLHFLRPEQTFAGLEALQAQIAQDAARAQAWHRAQS